jgi:hypothetical protein
MSCEEYAARGIGRFCEAAATQLDANCTLLDYADLNPSTIQRVARTLGIPLPPPESPEMQALWGTWSKDPAAQRPFEDDRERKRLAATETVKVLAERWALPHYQILRQGCHKHTVL